LADYQTLRNIQIGTIRTTWRSALFISYLHTKKRHGGEVLHSWATQRSVFFLMS